jgi:hypothetical protein
MNTEENDNICPYCGDNHYTCESRGISAYTGDESWDETCTNSACPINDHRREQCSALAQ